MRLKLFACASRASRLGAATGSVASPARPIARVPSPVTRSLHMRSSRRGRSIVASVLAALMLVVAACGSDESSSTESTATTGGGDTAKAIKVGLVTDIGGLNDRGFNQLANQGLERAKAELGITGEVRESKQPTDYVPNLSYFATQGY